MDCAILLLEGFQTVGIVSEDPDAELLNCSPQLHLHRSGEKSLVIISSSRAKTISSDVQVLGV